MDIDKKANELLLLLADNLTYQTDYAYYAKLAKIEELHQDDYAVIALEKRGLVEISTLILPPVITITIKGLDVIKDGGYLKLRERERILNEKEMHDAQISAFQARTRWWPHIIAIISLILSLVAIILTLYT